MKQDLNIPINHLKASEHKTIRLDYLFGEGEQLTAFQLVSFNASESWDVFQDKILLARIQKKDNIWQLTDLQGLTLEEIERIGKFIDSQHFNFLPGNIKKHWETAIQEVILQNDSFYLIICKPGVNFESFKTVFSTSIGQLVKDEWAVEFIVYNADFSNDFMVRVF